MDSQQTSYVEYEPSSCLQTYLHCYWSYHTKSSIDLLNANPIIPDGCLDIIFDLNIPTQSQCFIVGAMTKPLINKKNNLFGVRFKPGMATSLIDSAINEMTDCIVDIENIKHYETESIAYKLVNKKSDKDKVLFLNNIFLQILSPQPLIEKQTKYALNLIEKTNGKYSIQEISEKVGWSRQHLTRNFLRHTGLTPKFYSQVVRVNNLIHSHEYEKKHDWADIAQTCGYFDQAHMINEFKKITGVTPQIFLKNS